MKLKDIVKESMCTYPSIAPSKFSVYYHLFAVIGNGFEWNAHGELEAFRYKGESKRRRTMDFSDLDKRQAQYKKELAKHIKEFGKEQSRIYRLHLAELEAERMQRHMTAKHMNLLLEHSCSHSLSNRGNNHRLLHYMKPEGVCYDYAHIFKYPENVAKDWAEGMLDFIGVWQVALNVEYGVGGLQEKYDPVKAIAHWSDKAKELWWRLEAIKEDLLNKSTGTTPEQRKENIRKLMDRLFPKEQEK